MPKAILLAVCVAAAAAQVPIIRLKDTGANTECNLKHPGNNKLVASCALFTPGSTKSVQAQLNALSQRVTNLENTIGHSQTGLAKAHTKIDNNADDIADNAGDISTNAGDISDNADDISDNAEAIENHHKCKSGWGWHLDSKTCKPCVQGQTWSNTHDNSACKAVSIPTCPKGEGHFPPTTQKNYQCKTCPNGKYSNQSGKYTCKGVNTGLSCPSGKYKADYTASVDHSCKTCGNGKYQSQNAYKSNSCTSYTGPTACAKGKGWVAGTTKVDRKCVNCDGTSKYSDQTGSQGCKSTSIPSCPSGEGYFPPTTQKNYQCKGCPSGKYSNQSGKYTCKGVNTVLSCPSGKYKADYTASVDHSCKTCGSGKYQSQNAYKGNSCTSHSGNCPSGKYYSSGTTKTNRSCKNCGSQTKYKYGSNKSSCKTCPSSSYTYGGSESTRTHCASVSSYTNTCQTKYTGWNSMEHTHYLDRHDGNCPSNKEYLRSFKLESYYHRRRHRNRYRYVCCGSGGSSCTNHYTSFSDSGGGHVNYLDRHNVNCPTGKTVERFLLQSQYNRRRDKKRIHFRCCGNSGGYSGKCYGKTTGWNDSGGKNMEYLDRQNVECPTSQPKMKQFVVQSRYNRRRDNIRYSYTCCTP